MLWKNNKNCVSVISSLLFVLIIIVKGGNADSYDCNKSDTPLTCHGVRVIRNVMHHVVYSNNDSPLKLIPGLEIIDISKQNRLASVGQRKIDGSDNDMLNNVDDDGRSLNSVEDNSIIGRIAKYLQNHEIKIKFPELLEKKDFKDVILTAMKSIDEGKGVVEGRKKDKGGLGMIMMMGLMMGKMMGALGLGGVGLLAMKALGVSMMALMLAAIIGIKKLAEGGHDDGGHQVHYVSSHGEHHRKRREIDDVIPLPYKGWSHYAVNVNKKQ